MIYTLTLNPSLDYIMKTKEINIGEVNRSSEEHVLIGGKGINVSYVLNQLGVESVILGFVAGFTGDFILKELESLSLNQDLIKIKDGISRINVKIKNKNETEINGKGPSISEDEKELLIDKIKKLKNGDILVLSGSVISNMDEFTYANILESIEGLDVVKIVDTTGKQLLNTLKYKPFLIKPNIYELGELFDVKITKDEDVIKYSKKLIDMGAKNVLVSMDKKGAFFVNNSAYAFCRALKGKLSNSTGAGDSMIAGFIYKYLLDNDINKAFDFSVKTGSIAAFCEYLPKCCDLEVIVKHELNTN